MTKATVTTGDRVTKGSTFNMSRGIPNQAIYPTHLQNQEVLWFGDFLK